MTITTAREVHRYDATAVAYTEATDGTAQMTGLAIPYATSITRAGITEQFAPRAIEDYVGAPLMYGHNYTDPDAFIGYVASADNTDAGLDVVAPVTDPNMANKLRAIAKAGGRMGLSVGVEYLDDEWSDDGTAVTHKRARLVELTVTPVPTFDDARVISVNHAPPSPEGHPSMTTAVAEPTAPAPAEVETWARQEDLDTIRTQLAQIEARALAAPPAEDFDFPTLGHYAQAAFHGDAPQLGRYALTLQDTAGNTGLINVGGPRITREIQGIVEQRTPLVNAFGRIALPSDGTTFHWPRNDTDLDAVVAAQSAEGAELNSAVIDFTDETVSMSTRGAAFKNAWQLLRRSDPSYLEAKYRVALQAYGLELEKAFAAAMLAAATGEVDLDELATTLTLDGLLGALVDASFAVEDAVGAQPNIIAAGRTVFKTLVLLEDAAGNKVFPYASSAINAQGDAAALGPRLSVNGQMLIPSTNVSANTIVVAHSDCMKAAVEGPMTAEQDQVGTLTKDTAVYGFDAFPDYQPSGIVLIHPVA